MKTIGMAVGAVILAGGAAFAQQQEDPVERQVQRYKDQLKLTDEQIPKVREVLKKEHDALRPVLTDTQKTTLDQGRGNRPGGTNNGGNNNGKGGHKRVPGLRRGARPPPPNHPQKSPPPTHDQGTKNNENPAPGPPHTRTSFQKPG